MSDVAARALHDVLIKWMGLVHGSARLVLVLAVALTTISTVYVVENVKINTDTEDMLSPELEFRRLSNDLKLAFPQYDDTITVVVDGDTPELADEAARRLTQELRTRSDVFGEVYDPEGHPFFRRNGLLYLDIDQLEELGDRLAEAQPFLGTLWRDPTLRGLFDTLGLALEQSVEGEAPIEVTPVLTALAEVLESQKEGRFHQLSWRELMVGGESDTKVHRRIFLIQPVLDHASLQPATKAIRTLRGLTSELGLEPSQGVRVRLTGSAALAQDELKSVQEGIGLAALLSLTLVLCILIFGLRSLRLVWAVLIPLVMGLIWTAGFAVAAIGELNLISVAFAVLFIGLSVDFGIHFGLRYKEEIDRGQTHPVALEEAVRGVGGALTLCAVAAAIGFFAFLPTAYIGLAELGLIAGFSMFIALFANLTVLPAYLTIMPLRPTSRRNTGQGIFRTARRLIETHPRRVLWGALALLIAAALIAPQARFDFDPLNLKDPGTESVATLFDLIESGNQGPYAAQSLTENVEEALALAEKLEELPEVNGTQTLARFLPEDQEEKLEIIETMALYLAPALSIEERDPPPEAAELRADFEQFMAALRSFADASPDGPAQQAALHLLAAMEALAASNPDDPPLEETSRRVLDGLTPTLGWLRDALTPENVTRDSLPASLVDRVVSADGRARLSVYPEEDLRDREALGRFVTAVRTVLPEATRGPVLIYEAGRAVIQAFLQAGLFAVTIIGFLLVLLLRDLRRIALVFAPLILATLMTIAGSVLLNLPFNFANVIVLPLLFGLGVASSIHVVLRERDEAGHDAVFETSTPRAVVLSALTTIGSFGSMALSSHPGTSSMGILLTIAIGCTLVCTLVLLPALIAAWTTSDAAGPPSPAPV